MKGEKHRKTRRSIPKRPKHVGSCTDLHWRLWSWVTRSETCPWPCSWPQWGDMRWCLANPKPAVLESKNFRIWKSYHQALTDSPSQTFSSPVDIRILQIVREQTPFFEAPSGFMLISIAGAQHCFAERPLCSATIFWWASDLRESGDNFTGRIMDNKNNKNWILTHMTLTVSGDRTTLKASSSRVCLSEESPRASRASAQASSSGLLTIKMPETSRNLEWLYISGHCGHILYLSWKIYNSTTGTFKNLKRPGKKNTMTT